MSTRFSLSLEMSRLTRDGTAKPASRNHILRHECGQGNIHFPCSAYHVQDWQPYSVDPYSCLICDYTSILYYASDPDKAIEEFVWDAKIREKSLAIRLLDF